jgi:hypothetical protein
MTMNRTTTATGTTRNPVRYFFSLLLFLFSVVAKRARLYQETEERIRSGNIEILCTSCQFLAGLGN